MWCLNLANLKLTYGNSRSARTPTLIEDIAKNSKYMDPEVTMKDLNMNKPMEFFKIRRSFYLVIFLGSCQNLHCSCSSFYHDRVCEQMTLFSLPSDCEFHVLSKCVDSKQRFLVDQLRWIVIRLKAG